MLVTNRENMINTPIRVAIRMAQHQTPCPSLMYFSRMRRFCLGSGSFVFSHSSMRPLRSSMSAIQCLKTGPFGSENGPKARRTSFDTHF